MNTDSNIELQSGQSTSRQIIKALDSCAIHMPITTMMQELQIMIERLTFAVDSSTKAIKLEDLEVLLGNDISKEMMTFIRWIHRYNLINLLVGSNGQQFLQFCARYYQSVREVRCTMPIAASEAFRTVLIGYLRQLYPEPARIIFETAPSIIAGCIIDDGQRKSDMSLSGKMPKLVGQYTATMRLNGAVSGR